uniref:Uncharacterized protein n=1 Tax=Ditylenchus dipsaci TaxID=166011 RepID=A0A915EUF8_9BILA
MALLVSVFELLSSTWQVSSATLNLLPFSHIAAAQAGRFEQELLSLEDRFSAELINKRWNRCTKNYGWRNLRICKDHGTSRARYLSLFKRCGKSLVELNIHHQPFFNSSSGGCPRKCLVYSLLPMLQNIRHISLSANCSSAPDLKIIAKSFPKLLSAELISLGPCSHKGLTFMLKNCKELNYLKFRDLNDFMQYDFADIPSSLKCLDVDHTVDSAKILSNAANNGCQLESLKVFAWAAPYLFDNFFYFKSLKYLCLYVQYVDIYTNLAGSLAGLRNLRALDLWSGLDGRQTAMALEAVVVNCQQLEHFSLSFHSSRAVIVDEGAFDQICNLPKLTSLSIGGNFQNGDGGRPSLQKFFERLTSDGRLKYIKLKTLLSVESVRNALISCTDLTRLGWRIKNDNEEWVKLLQTLNEIHGGCGPEEEHLILKIFCYCGLYRWSENMPYHPWVKFCTWSEPSPVREKYRVGCLINTPTFAGTIE